MSLSISVLGPLDVRVDGTGLDVDTRKAAALLVYLVLEGVDQPRDRLVDLLWSDSDVDRGRSSLRRTLSSLRTGLGGRWMDADRAFVGLDQTGVEVDLHRADRLLGPHERHPAGEVCATCIDDLTEAVALHRGPFLDGFAIRGAPAFEMWVATAGEAVTHRLDVALARLAGAHATGGDYDAAATATEHRIRTDPLREDAYRDLMRYRAWSGDRSGAVDVYRRAVGVLDAELGVRPLDETTELYEAILEEDLPRAPAPPRRAAPPIGPPIVPLVGRDRALATALAALSTAGTAVVVEGAPGSGVSRFLSEVSDRLLAQATPLFAVASDSERANPHGVINQALFDVVTSAEAGAALRALPTEILAEAGRIFPDLGAPPTESNPTRFMDALARMVAAIPNPILVVDDMHRADPASLAVIAFLAARARRIGLRLLVGVENDPSTATPDAVEEIARTATVISLGPLDRDEVAEFVANAGVDIDLDELLEQTGGLPLYLVEATMESREPGRSASRRVVDRLGNLPGVARQVYEAVAVLGRPTDPATLAAVAGRSPDEADEAIDVLVSNGLAVEEPSGMIRYAHGIMATAALDRLTVARRRLLNRRAAQALEARGEEPGRIARHHALAGDDAAAAQWHLQAGEAAAVSFAYQEALDHLEAALALGHPDRADLHRRMGGVALLAGRYERAIGEYEAALAAGDLRPAQIEHRLGEIMRRLGRWDLAGAHYERAAAAGPPNELAAVIESDHAYVEFRRAGHAAAQPRMERALAMADESGDALARARSRNVAGLVASEPEARKAHLFEALTLAEEPSERIAVLNNLARESAGDEAVDFANEALSLATATGDRHLMAALGNTLADALHAIGDTSASHAALVAAVELFADLSTTEGEPWSPEVWFLAEW